MMNRCRTSWTVARRKEKYGAQSGVNPTDPRPTANEGIAMATSIVADSSETPLSPTLATRREQMFPRLEPGEIQRLTRFGDTRSYAAGEFLARVGEPGLGLFAVLSGAVEVSQRRAGRDSQPI